MIKLERLTPNDFETFKSWIGSEEELVQFAGTIFTYPLTDEQLTRYITDTRRKAFKVIQEPSHEMIGHVELNLENAAPRLSRLIIGNKAYRGKKYGKKIILKLLEMAFMKHDASFVDVNVYDWNMSAMNCYQSVGFTTTPEESYSHDLNFKIWTAINMCITKTQWLDSNKLYISEHQLKKRIDLIPITKNISETIKTWEHKLSKLSNETISTVHNSQGRSIKQILGHLIDSASNNHQRIVRLQYNKQLDFPDYQQDNDLWIAIQNYQKADWKNLILLWKAYNCQITHIIKSVDQDKLSNAWQTFDGSTISLQEIIEGYGAHLELHLKEIQKLINKSK